MRIALSIILAGSLFLSAALAQSDTPLWDYEEFTMKVDVRGQVVGDVTYSGYRVKSLDETLPEIRFSCSDEKGLNATIIIKPLAEMSDAERAEHEGGKYKWRREKRFLKVGDGKTEGFPFIWVKKLKIVQSYRHTPSARIFNAVVTGTPFSINDDEITPTPMDDNFKAFAKNCPLTNGKG